eukprot:Gb_39093 [translate_table: standard]
MVFDSIAYAHIPKEKRSNLDDKRRKCIFIGYSEESKGYRLYDPKERKVIVRSEVSKNAMQDEYNNLVKNQTWELSELPSKKQVIGFRLILALVAQMGWKLHQMDVKRDFLNGYIDEEIYMEKPQGFVKRKIKVENSSLVCQLQKSLYGLKQAPQAWYDKMDKFLLNSGFSRCHSYPTFYTKKSDDEVLILVLYVDDLIITRSSTSLIHNINSSLMNQFDMIDLGLLHFFLGLQVNQLETGISIYQPKYALDLLRQLVGSLLYLTHSRPDLSFDVGLVSRFM